MRNNQEVAEQNKEILFTIWFSEDAYSGIVDDEVNNTFKLSCVWEFVDKSAYETCRLILTTCNLTMMNYGPIHKSDEHGEYIFIFLNMFDTSYKIQLNGFSDRVN